ncbi:protein SPT2 homolog [Littorina saxatilis]|uniref:protein SPT2 homolog n=1 Tax=Littorina saxatilis TaxID=31220 RepID=UPI0038B47719
MMKLLLVALVLLPAVLSTATYKSGQLSRTGPHHPTSGSGYNPHRPTSGPGPHRSNSGSSYDPHRSNSGSSYDPHRSNSGSSYDPHRSNSGSSYDPHRSNSGSSYDPHRSNSGSSYDPHRSNSGSGLKIRSGSGYNPSRSNSGYNPNSGIRPVHQAGKPFSSAGVHVPNNNQGRFSHLFNLQPTPDVHQPGYSNPDNVRKAGRRPFGNPSGKPRADRVVRPQQLKQHQGGHVGGRGYPIRRPRY